MLGSVHTLDMGGCGGVTDISALRNVKSLCIRNCSAISDISALDNVNILEIRECQNINILNVGGYTYNLGLYPPFAREGQQI
jgi:hypothetical protein